MQNKITRENTIIHTFETLRGCLNFIQNDVFLLLVSQSPKVRKDLNMDNPVHSTG